MSGRNKFECFSPGGAHQTAFTACTNVAVAFNRVGDDGVECFHRVAVKRLRLTVHFEQQTAHIGVFHAGRRVRVPREGCATGAPAGLIFGTIGTDCGIVSFLRFPGDNAVFDIHLPRAGTGAVHPVGGVDHLVVAPPVAVEGVGLAPSGEEQAAGVGRGLSSTQVRAQREQSGCVLDLLVGSRNDPGAGGLGAGGAHQWSFGP